MQILFFSFFLRQFLGYFFVVYLFEVTDGRETEQEEIEQD